MKWRRLWPLGLSLLLLAGCGIGPPYADHQIIAPSDATVTLYNGGTYTFPGPLVFRVMDQNGTKPLPGVEVEFYSDGVLIDAEGNPIGKTLGTGNVYYKTRTDAFGAVQIFVQDTYPACDPDQDQKYTTAVHAVSGGVSATWTATVTVPAC